MTTAEQQAKWREASQRYREQHREDVNARVAEYRASLTPEQREHMRLIAAERRRRPSVREAHRNRQRRWRRDHKAINLSVNRRWMEANPAKVREQRARRKALKNGVLLRVQVASEVCGVCQQALTTESYPDPLSTTLGHEPPLARAAQDGWLVIAERPEHLRCNLRKHAKLDCEMHRELAHVD